jgi:hypothetical protein
VLGMIHFITITLLLIILGLSGINSHGMNKTKVSDVFCFMRFLLCHENLGL